jgi:hypothetical protein
MNETFGQIVLKYKEAAAIPDPTNPGELTEGEQLVVVCKAIGDEREYSFQLPISPDLPAERDIDQWQKDGALVVISSSSVRAIPFQHVEKDEQGNVKRYPQPGKVFKVGNKNVEIGTLLSFQAYAIRLADTDDEQRAKVAHGRYLARQQETRMRSIEGRQAKAKERVSKRLQESKSAKKKSA